MNIKELVNKYRKEGYSDKNAEARVCQDIILKAISESSLSRNVTIKGGVVMRNITRNCRRATQDMDIDFIRYSLANEAIDLFVDTLNCLEDVYVVRTGEIEKLKQQDYDGKRVFVKITDRFSNSIIGKIDLGVHRYLEIEQEEYCFDIGFDDEGVSLLANSKEQMFAEKLKSLLKFGTLSTRYKDIYDMYYYCDQVDLEKLKQCFDIYIFMDSEMREHDIDAVIKRVRFIFGNTAYKNRVSHSDKRWLDDDISDIFESILRFLEKLSYVVLQTA